MERSSAGVCGRRWAAERQRCVCGGRGVRWGSLERVAVTDDLVLHNGAKSSTRRPQYDGTPATDALLARNKHTQGLAAEPRPILSNPPPLPFGHRPLVAATRGWPEILSAALRSLSTSFTNRSAARGPAPASSGFAEPPPRPRAEFESPGPRHNPKPAPAAKFKTPNPGVVCYFRRRRARRLAAMATRSLKVRCSPPSTHTHTHRERGGREGGGKTPFV